MLNLVHLNELCGNVLWKPSRDFTRPLGPPSGLKGLLHMLNATVIPLKGLLRILLKNTKEVNLYTLLSNDSFTLELFILHLSDLKIIQILKWYVEKFKGSDTGEGQMRHRRAGVVRARRECFLESYWGGEGTHECGMGSEVWRIMGGEWLGQGEGVVSMDGICKRHLGGGGEGLSGVYRDRSGTVGDREWRSEMGHIIQFTMCDLMVVLALEELQ
ncbi:hypothetical protein Tco_0941711 [Tanacetum coccineum]|uniref:Uncharacterized protein n=1 Tax=Tanacetum coccineum TaxID=301880 RepID=A0ABQ5DRP3_9ASTR